MKKGKLPSQSDTSDKSKIEDIKQISYSSEDDIEMLATIILRSDLVLDEFTLVIARKKGETGW